MLMNQKQQVVAARFAQLCTVYGLTDEETASLSLGVAIGAASTSGQLERLAETLGKFVHASGALAAVAQLKVEAAAASALNADNDRLRGLVAELEAELHPPPPVEDTTPSTEPPPSTE